MKQKLIKIFISGLLFICGLLATGQYLRQTEFQLLTLDTIGRELISTRSGELLTGDKVKGEFHSPFANLGQVSIRFDNQYHDSKDTIVFRLKEKEHPDWYYEAEYKTDQFLPHKHFSFGFPLIKQSIDKTYLFEIESLNGATGSGIVIDQQKPVFIGRTVYTKAELLTDWKTLTDFLVNKFFNTFSNKETAITTIAFFLPFILSLFFLSGSTIAYPPLVVVLAILCVYDIFYLYQSFDFFLLSVTLFWVATSLRYHFDSSISAIVALIFFGLSPLLLLSDTDITAEKATVWAYLLLCSAITLRLFETKIKNQKPLTLKPFIRGLSQFRLSLSYSLPNIPEPFKKLIMLFLGVYALIKPFVSMMDKLSIFKMYYKLNYFQVYIQTLVIPVLLLLSFLVILFVLTRKRFKSHLTVFLVLSLIFFFYANKIIPKSAKFEHAALISSISPNITNEAWTDVTVTGRNFRDKPFVGKVFIDGKEQGVYVIEWSNEKIVFRTNPQITKTGFLQVMPLDREVSNKVWFTYTFND